MLRRVFVALFILLLPVAAYAAVGAPAWHALRPGQVAYLSVGADDNHLIVVCSAVGLVNSFSSDRCPKRREGELVTVTGVVPHSPVAITAIASADGRWRGYVDVTTLEPRYAAGARIRLHATGNWEPTIWAHRHDGGPGIVLGGPSAVVQVIRQDRPDGDTNVLVRVLSGRHEGQVGWIIVGPQDTIEGTQRSASILGG